MTSPTRKSPVARMLLSELSAKVFVHLLVASRSFPFPASQLTAFDKSGRNEATAGSPTPAHSGSVIYPSDVFWQTNEEP
ncbi:MAG: hypothetical protein ACK523_14995, partial [Pirellulaceae bacterium]